MSVFRKRDYRLIRFLDTRVIDPVLNNKFEILTRNRFRDGEKKRQNCRSVDWAEGTRKIVKRRAFLRSALRSSVLSLIYFTYSTLILHVISSYQYHYTLSIYSSTVIASDMIIIFITIITQGFFFFITTSSADTRFVVAAFPFCSYVIVDHHFQLISVRSAFGPVASVIVPDFRAPDNHPPDIRFSSDLVGCFFLVFSCSEMFAAGEIASLDYERGKDTAFVRKIYYT